MIKFIRNIVLIVFLFLLSVFITLCWYKDVFITAIQELHRTAIPTQFIEKPLIRGDALHFEITAKYDNFGILKLRPKTFNRFNYDTIYFRLREKGTETWKVNNAYVVDIFKDKLFYPFGFPVIPDSKGKTYEIEITSEKGTATDSIGFYGGYNSIATQYVYVKENIISNETLLIWFAMAKGISLVKDPYFVLFYLLFFFPLMYFIYKQFVRQSHKLFLIEIFIILYMYLTYIFLPADIDSNIIIYIIFISFLIFSSYYYPIFKKIFSGFFFSSSYVFMFASLLLLYLLINIALNKVLETTRVAVAVYYTTVLALIISLIEFNRKHKIDN